MSLPSNWRLQVENNGLGTDVDVEIKVRGIQFDSSNLQPTYATWSSDLGFTNLTSGSFNSTAGQDNTTDGFNAVEVEVTLSNFGATPNDSGTVNVYFQGRGDGSSDWPDNGKGFVALVFDPDATGTFRDTQTIS